MDAEKMRENAFIYFGSHAEAKISDVRDIFCSSWKGFAGSLPEVGWRFCADGHCLILLIVALEDLFTLTRLQ